VMSDRQPTRRSSTCRARPTCTPRRCTRSGSTAWPTGSPTTT
jgi:hypothetical protein